MLIRSAFVFGSSIIAVVPELYEAMPAFKAYLPSSLFDHIMAGIGALMLLGGLWHAVRTASKIKEAS